MSWLIAAAVAIALGVLAWWSSGRDRPGLRRRRLDTEIGKQQGQVGMYGAGFPHDSGPSAGRHGF